MILRNYQVFNRFNILYQTKEKVGIDMWAPDQTIKVYRRGVVSSEKEGGGVSEGSNFYFLFFDKCFHKKLWYDPYSVP